MKKKPRRLKNNFERRISSQLEDIFKDSNYEAERIPYTYSGYYTPDFVINTPKGKIYLETKGYFRPEHKRVMRAAKATNPELDIRILFYGPNKKYARWAVKHGFPCAFGEIPEGWLNGL